MKPQGVHFRGRRTQEGTPVVEYRQSDEGPWFPLRALAGHTTPFDWGRPGAGAHHLAEAMLFTAASRPVGHALIVAIARHLATTQTTSWEARAEDLLEAIL